MRLITDVLRDIRDGRVVDAASEQMAEVVKAVADTQKPGELTIKIKVTPQGRGDNAVILAAVVTTKIPQPKLPDALFFTDLDGDLHRDDPTRQRMFADVNPPRADTRTA